YKSDGTAAGTVFLKAGLLASSATSMNGTVFFVGSLGGYRGLWKTDGTPAGTVQVSSISAQGLTSANGKLYFAGTDSNGTELWVTDGTAAGMVLVKDIYTGTTTVKTVDIDHAGKSPGPRWITSTVPNSSNPALANLAGKLLFTAYDGQKLGLWT